MLKNLKSTPAGTKDVLYPVSAVRDKLKSSLLDFYKMRGFDRTQTPVLEYYDVFDFSRANIPQQAMYKLTDKDGRLIVLRPDCTIPMARVASTRLSSSPRPLRLCYGQNIYTVNPAHSPRSNEILQIGIEIMGDTSPKRADLESIFLAFESLKKIASQEGSQNESQKPRFRIELCHIGYFKGIMDLLDASDEEKEEIRQLVEKKSYSSLGDKLAPYKNTKVYDALMLLPRMFGGAEIIGEARKNFINQKTDSALAYLEELYDKLKILGLEDIISVDLGMVNKSDYYTGIIFKGYFDGLGEEVLSGGRYDNLTEIYGRKMSAVGFGINIDLAASLFEPKEEKQEKILIFGEDGYEAKALSYISSFCESGVIAEYSVFSCLDDAISYARAKGFSRLMRAGKETDYIEL